MAKRFVNYSKTKAEFISAGLPATYNDSIVFIKGDANGNGACIYTHGNYFANFTELLSVVNYVKGINVGGTSYNAAAGGGYVAFGAKDPATVSVNAGSNGIEIGLTDTFIQSVDAVIELAGNINKDYLKASDKTALEGLISAASAKAQGAQDDIDALAEDVGNVDNLSTTNKEVVKAINEVLAAVGTGGTAAVVTITEKGATTDYAQVYEVKQGTTVVGTINIPKELVVSAGEVVTNPAGKPAGTYIKLTIQNVTDPLYIDVAKLVDVYTAQANATQVQLSIDANRVISATIKAGTITSTELATDAVTTIKVADGNITKAKLSSEVQTSLGKADAAAPQSTTYTKDEVDGLIDGVDVSAQLANYYTKTETYSKTEIDAMWEWEEL